MGDPWEVPGGPWGVLGGPWGVLGGSLGGPWGSLVNDLGLLAVGSAHCCTTCICVQRLRPAMFWLNAFSTLQGALGLLAYALYPQTVLLEAICNRTAKGLQE